MMNNDRTEARRLCAQARRLLEQALLQANSARGWGIADLLGGGLITTMVKRKRMNTAQDYIQQAKPLLQRLSALVGQMGLDSGLADRRPGGIASFFDYSDDFFAEIFTQSRISDMRFSIETTLSKLHALEKQLL